MSKENEIELPLSVQYPAVLLSILLTAYCLIEARVFLLPIAFAALFSFLLYPFARALELRFRFSRTLSTTFAIVVFLCCVALFMYFAFLAVSAFEDLLPKLSKRIEMWYIDAQTFIEVQFGIEQKQQLEWARQRVNEFLQKGGLLLTQTLDIITSILTLLVLIPAYIFLFLFFRDKIKEFIKRLNAFDDRSKIERIAHDVPPVVLNYVKGVGTRAAIEAALNTVGLLIIGIEYAYVLGPIGAFFAVIPFIGVIIAAIIPTLVALVTTDTTWQPLAVIGWYLMIQLVEEVYLEPRIVGGQVSLNPLAAFLAIIIGSALWGAAGLIIFMPLTAGLKVVFEHVDSLRPFAYFLSRDEPGLKSGEE